MPASVISNYTIHDQEKIEKYQQAVMPTILRCEGRVLAEDHDAKDKGITSLLLTVQKTHNSIKLHSRR